MGDPLREAHLGRVLRYALAAASFGAGLIHATAVSGHTEHEVLAAFFALLAAIQVGWALAVLRRPTVTLLKFGAILSVGVVFIWLLSRSTGLAGIPGAEEAEAVGLKDSLATALELLLAAGVGATFAGLGAGLRAASGRLASGLAVVSLGVLTATGMAASGGHESHHSKVGEHWTSPLAAGGHGHDQSPGGLPSVAGAHGHDTGVRSGGGEGRPHEVAAVHDAAHGIAPSALTLAASGHDHSAPGHVHDPAHHGVPGASHAAEGQHGPLTADAAHGHDFAPGHEAAPDHGEVPGHEADPGHEAPHQDGQGGDSPHGGHGSVNTCDGPVPDQRLSRDVQEYATYYFGVECLEPER